MYSRPGGNLFLEQLPTIFAIHKCHLQGLMSCLAILVTSAVGSPYLRKMLHVLFLRFRVMHKLHGFSYVLHYFLRSRAQPVALLVMTRVKHMGNTLQHPSASLYPASQALPQLNPQCPRVVPVLWRKPSRLARCDL